MAPSTSRRALAALPALLALATASYHMSAQGESCAQACYALVRGLYAQRSSNDSALTLMAGCSLAGPQLQPRDPDTQLHGAVPVTWRAVPGQSEALVG